MISFIAVLLPIGIGMLLGNLDPKIREFLKPGEAVTIPFFAFALGAGMDLANFFNPAVLTGGLTLAVLTFVCSAGTGILVFKLFKEKVILHQFQRLLQLEMLLQHLQLWQQQRL